MSKIDRRIVRCRECGKEFEAEFYGSINTVLNPELIEKVRDGSIFEVECPHCKKINHLHYPCLYHDQKNELMVQLNSFKNLLLLKETIDNKTQTSIKKLNNNEKVLEVARLISSSDSESAKVHAKELIDNYHKN